MQLHKLTSQTSRSKRRVGRGYGSTKGGHTTGRGQKGQKSRNSVAIWFEGGQLPMVKRLPFQRGKGRFKTLKQDTVTINLTQLNKLEVNSIVSPKTLVDSKLLSKREAETCTIKILGTGKLEKALTVQVPTSKSAEEKILKAGGKIDRGQA